MCFACFGCAIVLKRSTSRRDKLAVGVLLSLCVAIIVILARSSAEYAGVRHTLTIYFVMAILAGFATQYLVQLRTKMISAGVLGITLLSCLPALAVERPWEYHNRSEERR